MSNRREEKALHNRGPHTYTVKFAGNAPDPITVQADSFEIEADTVTFTTDGAPTAVVRGSWLVILQSPDVVVAEPA